MEPARDRGESRSQVSKRQPEHVRPESMSDTQSPKWSCLGGILMRNRKTAGREPLLFVIPFPHHARGNAFLRGRRALRARDSQAAC